MDGFWKNLDTAEEIIYEVGDGEKETIQNERQKVQKRE